MINYLMLKKEEIKNTFIILAILIIYNIMSKESFSKDNTEIIYINSNKLEKNRSNSVYDIDYVDDVIYIPDYRHNKIILFKKNGSVLKTIYSHAPHGIEVDNKKNIYVTDLLDNRIRKFDKDGNEIMKWDHHLHPLVKVDRPLSVDTDNNGNVYISAEN